MLRAWGGDGDKRVPILYPGDPCVYIPMVCILNCAEAVT